MIRSPRAVSRIVVALAVAAIPIAQAGLGQGAKPTIQNTYTAYDVGADGGEPSIGVNFKTNAVMAEYGTTTLRATFDDTKSPPKATFTDVSPLTNDAGSFDAILTVDSQSGRTFVSQLQAACSTMSFTDDDGATWTPSEGCGPGALLDHQSVAVGPLHAPLDVDPLTARAVYYCAQNGYSGACAPSLDGGMTFTNAVPAYNTPINDLSDSNATYMAEGGACTALHGHMKVGPDGTAYLPLNGCGGQPTASNLTNTEYWGGEPALSISTDNGLTYSVSRVPGGHSQNESDSSLGIGRGDKVAGGRIFYGWEDGVNPSATGYGVTTLPKISVSDDHGLTWSKPFDLSAGLGIHNVQFPVVVAGDDDRAAMAWLGTTTIGDDQHNGFNDKNGKPAVWDMYISTTYDGGKTWTTIDATPKDPVQRGCVDLQGISNKTVQDANICNQRNMLDFNDATVDNRGRVLIAYADGCIDKCIHDTKTESHANRGYILRQTTGKGLFAAYDAAVPTIKGGGKTSGGTTKGGTKVGGEKTSRGRLPGTGVPSWPTTAGIVLIAGALAMRRWRLAR